MTVKDVPMIKRHLLDGYMRPQVVKKEMDYNVLRTIRGGKVQDPG